MRSEILVDTTVLGLEENHRLLEGNLFQADVQQSKYVGENDRTFEIWNQVRLPTRHFWTTRLFMILEYKRTGPYTVSMIINKNPFKLDLPKTMQNHNVCHVSQLDNYTLLVVGQPSSEPHPVILDNSKEWEVEWIFDSTQC